MENIKSRSLALSFIFFLISFSVMSQKKIGIFDGHGDVGTNVKPGSATYIPENGQYIISGAGYNKHAADYKGYIAAEFTYPILP